MNLIPTDRERKLNSRREHKISRRTRIHERILLTTSKLNEEAIKDKVEIGSKRSISTRFCKSSLQGLNTSS